MFARIIPRRPSLALIALAGCFIPTLARAQAAELKPARIEYEYHPTSGAHGLGGPDSEARFQAARASLAMPMPMPMPMPVAGSSEPASVTTGALAT